ncbi:MAG: hypothetical protein DCO97_21060 [Marivita sp. XM-24bin2]|uniref:DNA-binding protein n=1 Tax=Marivita sp. XM-24bin2 TaxID=2133951 RepID=UPI000D7B8CC6|nr:DNA-binding protein [Marivita sp. XM-24bin2]PWL32738.1 MAG: hypothetical protein DCO97_21060 [Marivita sp. XM-24bin2]
MNTTSNTAHPPIVTKEKIFSFCDQIAARGERPTTTKLHQCLGFNGSKETINRYRKMWEELFGREHYTAPPEIPQKLRAFFEESVASAWALAFEDISAQYNHRIEHIENERDELSAKLSVIDELEQKNDRALMRIGALEHENAKLLEEIAALRKNLTTSKAQPEDQSFRPKFVKATQHNVEKSAENTASQ